MFRTISLFIMLSGFAVVTHSETTDFDMICGFFNELNQTQNIKEMSSEQKADFVDARITAQLNEGSDAKVAWAAILSAPPQQRYELFKSAAESILPKKWNCPAMKQLAPTTGD